MKKAYVSTKGGTPLPAYEYRYRRPQRRRIRWRWILIPLVAALLVAYPFFEATLLTIDEHTVTVSNLHPNLKNLKIVYASDIHQGLWFSQSRVNELVTTLNNLSADIVVLGGDYAADSEGAIRFFENMPPLNARLGVFAVVGENDRTDPEGLSALATAMRSRRITPLVNEISRVKVGQTYLYMAGVDDYQNGVPDVEGVARQVKADDFVILASHSPEVMNTVLTARSADSDNHWFDLALMGHTHGGQINLFGYTPFPDRMPAVGARYLSGWREENRAAILVSNGVGTAGFPIRLFAQPQIHLITLKSR